MYFVYTLGCLIKRFIFFSVFCSCTGNWRLQLKHCGGGCEQRWGAWALPRLQRRMSDVASAIVEWQRSSVIAVFIYCSILTLTVCSFLKEKTGPRLLPGLRLPPVPFVWGSATALQFHRSSRGGGGGAARCLPRPAPPAAARGLLGAPVPRVLNRARAVYAGQPWRRGRWRWRRSSSSTSSWRRGSRP